MEKCVAAIVLLACLTFACTCASAQSYRYGDHADEIGVIQEALEELDLYYADITGHYGAKTERAVKLFQKKTAWRRRASRMRKRFPSCM